MEGATIRTRIAAALTRASTGARAQARRLLRERRAALTTEWAMGGAAVVLVAVSFGGVGSGVTRAAQHMADSVAIAAGRQAERERIERMEAEFERLKEEAEQQREAAEEESFWGSLGSIFGGPPVGTDVGEAVADGDTISGEGVDRAEALIHASAVDGGDDD